MQLHGIPFIRCNEEVAYEGRTALLMTQLRADAVLPKGPYLDSWWNRTTLPKECFDDNHV